MNKITTAEQAVKHICSGDTVLIGGFLQGGSPETLIKALLSTDATNLTIVSNDTGTAQTATIQLIAADRVKKVVASYIGANPETGKMLMNDFASVELCPQGTLAERLRAAGFGLGGVLTPVGIGTLVAEGKQMIEVDGGHFLLEKPLKGDIALIHASIADESGNCFMRGATKNFNLLMPAAAKYVIVEAEQIVSLGALDPELVHVPSILVDAVVPKEVV